MATKASMVVQMRNPIDGEIVSCTLTDLNPALFPEDGTISQDNYQKADTVGRRICALSSNTYIDTLITRTESVTEILNS